MARRTVDFSPRFDSVLDRLAERHGVTKAEILRKAVATYSYLDEEVRKGDVNVSLTDKETGFVKKDLIMP